ncbi:MAG: hypothetical protein ACM3X6_11565 [Patescibacteria group bacterium]
MDRLLTLAKPVPLKLSPGSLMLIRQIAAGTEAEQFCCEQLSANTWGYAVNESCISLVTRVFTAQAVLDATSPGMESILLETVSRTNPQHVTAAFRNGWKIEAVWAPVSALRPEQTAPGGGAAELWAELHGTASEGTAGNIANTGQPHAAHPHAQERTPERVPVEKGGPPANEPPQIEEEVLPQNEIDRLINAMQGRDAGTAGQEREVEYGPPRPPARETVVSEAAPEYTGAPVQPVTPQTPEPEPEPMTPPPLSGGGSTPPPSAIHTGISPEEWTGAASNAPMWQTAGQAPKPAAGRRRIDLADLLSVHNYVIIISEQPEDFDGQLESLQAMSLRGSFLAFREGRAVEVKLGSVLKSRLEHLRDKYRHAATAMEASITRIRQLEQLLPNLMEYQEQQAAMQLEEARLADEMRELHLSQLVGLHEGQALARQVFEVEGRRQAAARKLARASYAVLRGTAPTFLRSLAYRRAVTGFFRCQRRLESRFAQLSVLEGEVKRRLEYQADWQALVRRQIKIQRELSEITRFIRTTVMSAPGGAPSRPDELKSWVEKEWESVRRREKLLRAWQRAISDEEAWSVRCLEEPMIVLGDAQLLERPRLLHGGHVVLIASERDAIGRAPAILDECSSWVVLDPATHGMVGSGRGVGQTTDPFGSLLGELAREAGYDLSEVLHHLGLAEEDLRS